ncbi:hypothetical protein FGO68_gene12552 [Halteria grandinella]|uniref:Uncharacterized protein n=1 Tax=Halteria grandinella TaxID=5974 RepID=A0A8J8TA97_HALGN|nr:hypothetical protein FGO68_gene12552 [Halteria grandinella]
MCGNQCTHFDLNYLWPGDQRIQVQGTSQIFFSHHWGHFNCRPRLPRSHRQLKSAQNSLKRENFLNNESDGHCLDHPYDSLWYLYLTSLFSIHHFPFLLLISRLFHQLLLYFCLDHGAYLNLELCSYQSSYPNRCDSYFLSVASFAPASLLQLICQFQGLCQVPSVA